MSSPADPVHRRGLALPAVQTRSSATAALTMGDNGTAAPSQPEPSTSSSHREPTPAALKFVTSPLMSLINLLSRQPDSRLPCVFQMFSFPPAKLWEEMPAPYEPRHSPGVSLQFSCCSAPDPAKGKDPLAASRRPQGKKKPKGLYCRARYSHFLKN